MSEYIVGQRIKVTVIGFQPYGLFVRPVDKEEYSGLIHISEISYGYVKDVTQIAQLNDVVEVKILDVDKVNKHLKLSIKATLERTRVSGLRNAKYYRQLDSKEIKDFTKLASKLNDWIKEEVKGDKPND